MADIDYMIYNWVINLRNAITEPIFIFITYLGNLAAIWIILMLWLVVRNSDKKFKTLFYTTILPLIIVGVNEYILKGIIQRPRPFITYKLDNILIQAPLGFSMPSGHSFSSFIMAVILAHYFPKYKFLFYALAFLIAFSRVFVGVHYPMDVLLGSILGFIIGKFYVLILEKVDVKE